MDIVKKFLLNNSHSDGKTNTTEHTFQVDYTTPVGKLHTIEAGAKYIIRNNLSDNKLFEAEASVTTTNTTTTVVASINI